VWGWLLKGDVMIESGLANRGSRNILRLRGGACGREIDYCGEAWLAERGDVGDGERVIQTLRRPGLSGLLFAL